MTVQPRPGLLLLWESWLRHEVLPGAGEASGSASASISPDGFSLVETSAARRPRRRLPSVFRRNLSRAEPPAAPEPARARHGRSSAMIVDEMRRLVEARPDCGPIRAVRCRRSNSRPSPSRGPARRSSSTRAAASTHRRSACSGRLSSHSRAREFMEEADLAEHRPDMPHLPQHPLQRLVPARAGGGSNSRSCRPDRSRIAPDSNKASGFPSGPFGSMIAGILPLGFSDRNSGVQLSFVADHHQVRLVRQPGLLEHDRDLHAIRRVERIELEDVGIRGRPAARDRERSIGLPSTLN